MSSRSSSLIWARSRSFPWYSTSYSRLASTDRVIEWLYVWYNRLPTFINQ
jgi:hypothetical protein